MKFYPANKYEFSEVYDWLRSSDTGSTGVVQTDTVIYVIRLNSITDFEQLKNTDTMLQWTRTFGVNRDLSALLSSDRYPLKVVESVYEKCDLSAILKEAYEFWKSSLENDTK